jgi:hypothetical protein
MVQAADFGKPYDLPRRRELDRPEVRRVLVEREVGARLMVIGEVAGQDAAEVALAENKHVIQALAPDRSDESLRERVLPRAVLKYEGGSRAAIVAGPGRQINHLAAGRRFGEGHPCRGGTHGD